MSYDSERSKECTSGDEEGEDMHNEGWGMTMSSRGLALAASIEVH
jgi:hypothetical protein